VTNDAQAMSVARELDELLSDVPTGGYDKRVDLIEHALIQAERRGAVRELERVKSAIAGQIQIYREQRSTSDAAALLPLKRAVDHWLEFEQSRGALLDSGKGEL